LSNERDQFTTFCFVFSLLKLFVVFCKTLFGDRINPRARLEIIGYMENKGMEKKVTLNQRKVMDILRINSKKKLGDFCFPRFFFLQFLYPLTLFGD
jgi:hypothetical protein